MKLLPTTLRGMTDWLVEVDFIDHDGKPRRKVIAVKRHGGDMTENEAIMYAANSLKRRGILPPKIADFRPRRRFQAQKNGKTCDPHPKGTTITLSEMQANVRGAA